MNGCKNRKRRVVLTKTTLCKTHYDTCVYVDKSVDLVDFLRKRAQKMTLAYNLRGKDFMQNLNLVLNQSIELRRTRSEEKGTKKRKSGV